ncbi:MAG TPA: hypothetical protein VII06_05550 [Chloroflexota bacterium]|jgi:hypothetical protein
MLQDDRAANSESAGQSAIERVQRELAETRTALQGETTQISQLQQTLEEALRVARGVRLEALTELDRLAGDLMDAARRDAAAIRAQAEDEAQTLRAHADEEIRAQRAQAEADIRAQRDAADAAAAAQRADLDRRVRAAQAELDHIQHAWSTAAQALSTARENLVAGLPDFSGGEAPAAYAPAAPPPAIELPPPAAEPAPAASAEVPPAAPPADPFGGVRPTAGSVPGWGTSSVPEVPSSQPEAPVWNAPPPEPVPEPPALPVEPVAAAEPYDMTHFDLAPSPVAEIGAEGEHAPEPPLERQEHTQDLGPASTVPLAEGAAAELFEGPSGSPLERAGQQLRGGDVSGALDTYRGIVDRSPEEVESVISRLTVMLHEPSYRGHHEEVRLLLVDAYMVQGDYDRAMSLLHEPAS